MTTVIDRLRVQGGAAPGNPSNFDRSHTSRLSTRRGFTRKAHSEISEQGRLYIGPSPMARRMDIASAYRETNTGFSSMEVPQPHNLDSDVASKVSFVLSGKGVSDSISVRSAPTGPRLTRAGSYKITPREQYCVTHGVSIKDGSEPLPFGHGIHACFDPDFDDLSRASLRTAKSTRSQADMNGHKSAASMASNLGRAPPSTAATSTHPRAVTSLELTGQRYINHATDEFGYYDAHILDNSCFPYLRSPRRSFRFPHVSQPYPGETLSQLQDLHECLKINKTVLPGSRKTETHHTASKAQKDQQKKNFEDIKKDLRRYEFTNIASYLRFNRQQDPSGVVNKPRLAHIPRGVITLPEPWAESVLMKLMRDLRPPRSRMSSVQYSDVANQEDLDEFFVIGSPTSLDKHTDLFGNLKSPGMLRKSQRKAKGTIATHAEDKIVEEDVTTIPVAGNIDGNNTARTDSSVDPNDIQRQSEISEIAQPDIAVSIKLSRGESKDFDENTNDNSNQTLDKESDLKTEEKIIVPGGNDLCAENNSLSSKNYNKSNNDS